ncbi:hypothetical protein SAMN04489797_1714 [Winogradskyella sediminis]|uniref:Uncharacterized protein n=2 Tax=Winogradskyella sediminis TaxID=1382466 RepID=A0A1H1SM87_9FLAO|nr:hypothetical protein SAMN04489797_1714 [Winogradskyella sediminis]
MSDEELAEILKYSSSVELYIVTWNNILKLLYCPFEVLVMHDVGVLIRGQKVMVDEVKVTHDLQTVYIIKNVAYYYYHFEIVLE